MGRVVVDPVTRIEGHLRIDVEVDGGVVRKAWSSAQMFRGIETIIKGRDPKDTWLYAQRFCGVCTTAHAIASIRSVEDALDLEIPLNAQYIRNMIIASHAVQDFVVHFYHLSALDWVDIVSALSADPVKAASIASSYSDWHLNTVAEFSAAKNRLASFVNRGKLGIFGSGYWGHPAMKLPPEVNLIAFDHYLQALDCQRTASKITAILGGKDPHIQNLCVGGVATAINMDNMAAFNMERVALLRKLIAEMNEFVSKVYIPDVLAIAGFYPDWFGYGAGSKNYLSIPEYPIDSTNTKFQDIGGLITAGDLNSFYEFKNWRDPELRDNIVESTAHSWYNNVSSPLHPHSGESNPAYTDFEDEGRYSWCKTPRYKDLPYEVGPLASILAGYAAKEPKTVALVDWALDKAKLPLSALFSTLGRHLARALRCKMSSEHTAENLEFLVQNIASGDNEYANPKYASPTDNIPADREYKGVGFHEPPRGTLSHWIVINKGVVDRYQAVVPSTWNSGPKDEKGVMGPYEASLIDNPVADETKPLEVIRTIHSFDPCIACAVHTLDPEGKEVVKVIVN
ncbi:MAG: nickel-dependent hydrogenase large subunit [Deferribacteraceae bacterium]|jgi:hydrogenase large subunit|nr:nickel-dependent hydrogenase large subunit [Deferribacteraceae bacterium]